MYSGLAGIVRRIACDVAVAVAGRSPCARVRFPMDCRDEPRRFCRILTRAALRYPRPTPLRRFLTRRRALAERDPTTRRRRAAHERERARPRPGRAACATIRTTSSASRDRDAVDRDDRVAADAGRRRPGTPRSRVPACRPAAAPALPATTVSISAPLLRGVAEALRDRRASGPRSRSRRTRSSTLPVCEELAAASGAPSRSGRRSRRPRTPSCRSLERIWALIPITRPRASKSGPPELPWLIGASVWIASTRS